MRLKIYFEDKPLFLADTIDEEIEAYRHHEDAVFMDELSSPAINSMIHEMRLNKIHAGIYIHKNAKELIQAFFKKFHPITAAGGLVFDEQKNILMIFRRGKWDLPKGKLDPNEAVEACAQREVEEETGLRLLQIVKPLLTTYHTYEENGKLLLKDTHWFVMRSSGKKGLTPQQEEGITRVEWVSPDTLDKYAANTYGLIRDVLSAGLNRVK